VWKTGGKIHRILRGHTSAVTDATFSPDKAGKLILTTGSNGTTRVWDATTGSTCAVLGGGAAPIEVARFVSATRVITLDVNGTLREAPLEVCRTALQNDLRPIAPMFLRGLSDTYLKALATRP
jgi:WD40 repeat protein